MLLYHGSTELVDRPEIRRGQVFLDFGAGFYTTTSFAQAERWARIKMRRQNTDTGYVSVYELDFDAAREALSVNRFEQADAQWLHFVAGNRRGEAMDAVCDLSIGPVADDNVYQTIRLFETGAYDAEYTVRRLKTEVLHDQWTFHTDVALKHLRFREAKDIR